MPLTKSITVNKPLESVRNQWQSIEGVMTSDRAVVSFTSVRAGKETEIRVELLEEESPDAASRLVKKAVGAGVVGDVDRALRQFKQIVEVGEITLSDASIHEGMHSARPAAPDEKTVLTTPFVSVAVAVQP